MHRCVSGFLLTLAIACVAALTGCLGKSSSNPGNGGVESVSLVPGGNLSLDVGGTLVFSASGKNATGGAVLGAFIQFVVAVPAGSPTPAPLSIASNGHACAGTWDASDAICTPGAPGIALVTAVINGVNSIPATVYVHYHIDGIQITSVTPQGPPPQQYDCFSQGQTWEYAATAFSGNPPVDITNSVGPITWSSSNVGVVTTTPYVNPKEPSVLNLVQTTAKAPGFTQLFAGVSGVTSAPYPYTTCLIQAIWLQIGGQSQAGNSITVNTSQSVPVTAIAVDTLCQYTDVTLANPPLTWSTTNPEVIAFTNTTNSTGTNTAAARNNPGGATIFASCTPPTCNIGILPGLPIYASDYPATPPTACQPPNVTKGYGTISVDVTLSSTAKPPTYTAWTATTGCQNQPGCASALFAVTPGTTPIGSTILTVPRTPNSMMFNHLTAARLYLGSDQGLMYADFSAANLTVSEVSGSSNPCNVSLCGKVLTISNDGKLVVVSDTVSTPSQVYIYNAGNTSSAPVDLIIPGETATAAAFSPDQLKLFILTNAGNMYVYSTVDALASVQLAASATDVSFSADGSFAYVAGTPAGSVSAYSTCSLPTMASVNIASVDTSGTPLKIFPSPVVQAGSQGLTQNVIALEQPNTNQGTSIEFLTAQFTQDPILYSDPLQLTCNVPKFPSFTAAQPVDLGQGNFTPIYSQLVANGTEMIIVAQNIPAVLLFNVSNGTTTSVPLARSGFGSSYPFSASASASASTDGSQVYVAACDQYPNNDPTQPCAAASVHLVCTANCTAGQGDYQQVPYVNINDNNDTNMCNNGGNPVSQCFPNLVAIRPE